jgi:hypothetical protein
LFWKRQPIQVSAEGVRQTVIKMDTRPDVHRHVTGSGEVSFEPSAGDPLHQLKITWVFGASFTTGHQVLPWGETLD